MLQAGETLLLTPRGPLTLEPERGAAWLMLCQMFWWGDREGWKNFAIQRMDINCKKREGGNGSISN